MKNKRNIFVVVLFLIPLFANNLFGENQQGVPDKFSYQCVIRNSENQLVQNKIVSIQISILYLSADGAPIYTEKHKVSTNKNGLATLIIGQGETQGYAKIEYIPWHLGVFYIKTDIDPEGGENYTISGVNQILSVPFATYAKSAANGLKQGSSKGEMLYWDGENWMTVQPGQNDQALVFCNGVPTWGGCLPNIEITNVKDLFFTSATAQIKVTSESSPLIDCGVCWSKDPYPTVENSLFQSSGTNAGSFEVRIGRFNPLDSNSVYFLRGYATNKKGTLYSKQVKISTKVPILREIIISNITGTSFSFETGCDTPNDSTDYQFPVDMRYLRYSSDQNSWTTYNDGSNGYGSFSGTISRLQSNTTYYIESVFVSHPGWSAIIAKSPMITITTGNSTPPILNKYSTVLYQDVLQFHLTDYIDNGGIDSMGICWSKDSLPTIENEHFTTSYYSGELKKTNMKPYTPLHFRPYIINRAGIGYGEDIKIEFRLPIISTENANTISHYSAKIGFNNLFSDADKPVLSSGICIDTIPNPTIEDQRIDSQTGINIDLTNLTPNTTYYCRAFAENSVGFGYGNEISFTTLTPQPPLVRTLRVSSIKETSAEITGETGYNNGTEITSKGICWSNSQIPTLGSSLTSSTQDETGNSRFSIIANNLNASTSYNARAYAINQAGVGYGEIFTFQTNNPGITLFIDSISNISHSSIKAHLKLYAFPPKIATRGVCWSESSMPTIDDSSQIIVGNFQNIDSMSIRNLQANTTYNMRFWVMDTDSLVHYSSTTTFSTRRFRPNDLFGGGIVFKVDSTGRHGLISTLSPITTTTFGYAGLECDNYINEGFDNWRLPTYLELRDYVLKTKVVPDGDYWSSDTVYDDSALGIRVEHFYERVNLTFRYILKHENALVWPIRNF